MSAPRNIANLYAYDPLDRLISARSIKRFYNRFRTATEIAGDGTTCFFEHETVPLAELKPGDAAKLLATDQQRTVVCSINDDLIYRAFFSPYGHRPAESGLLTLLGFNGERPDPVTGHYLLGQGYRAYNPVLMRFNSPDGLGPFGEGGFNVYTYCENDPINCVDPSGRAKLYFLPRRIFNQPDVSDALSRVKKSLGSINKVNSAPGPNTAGRLNPPNTLQKNPTATNGYSSGGADSRREPSTLTRKKMDDPKGPIAQNRTTVAPIHNFASPGEWDVQLTPGPLRPTTTRSPLRPIHNYAAPGAWEVQLNPGPLQPAVSRPPLRAIYNYSAPGEWGVRLIPDPMQPVIRLIRTDNGL
jgi:RHS repeat-associated protein